MSRVIVIGGGPAGIMAAGRAAECGANVILCEKGPKLARKLRISGKGRGNISNTAELKAFINAFAPNGKFLYGAFSRFFRDDLLDLLLQFGVETKIERGGRIFPVSDKAGDVADALEKWMISAGAARTKLNTRIRAITITDNRVTGIQHFGGTISADAVVLATGGASYPKTGSTGDGYSMARETGHTIVQPEPALSAMITKERWAMDLQGLSLKNVEASLIVEQDGKEKKIAPEFGEMLFTHFGVSGPIILTLSRAAREYLKNGPVTISIDLKPALSYEQLHARLIRDFTQTRQFGNYARELLPRLLADMFAAGCMIHTHKPVNSITSEERARIVSLLKDLRLTVTGFGTLEEAIVTAGGVPIGEIDPRTMMSKLVHGLFFAGEVMDVDAETGGFNLQAAFSTGYVAGEAAAALVADQNAAS